MNQTLPVKAKKSKIALITAVGFVFLAISLLINIFNLIPNARFYPERIIPIMIMGLFSAFASGVCAVGLFLDNRILSAIGFAAYGLFNTVNHIISLYTSFRFYGAFDKLLSIFTLILSIAFFATVTFLLFARPKNLTKELRFIPVIGAVILVLIMDIPLIFSWLIRIPEALFDGDFGWLLIIISSLLGALLSFVIYIVTYVGIAAYASDIKLGGSKNANNAPVVEAPAYTAPVYTAPAAPSASEANAGGNGISPEAAKALTSLNALFSSGAITAEEYNARKSEILGR